MKLTKYITNNIISTEESSTSTSLSASENSNSNLRPLELSNSLRRQTLNPAITRLSPQASNILVSGVRRHFSTAAEKHMLSNGKLWRDKKVNSLEKLSESNIKRIRSKLDKLEAMEAQFLENLKKSRFFATHSTHADVTNGKMASIFSYKKLKRNEIKTIQDHTYPTDSKILSNDDFVFFYLQCNDAKLPYEKLMGYNVLKFDINLPQFSHAWLSIDDMTSPQKTNGIYVGDVLPTVDRKKLLHWHKEINKDYDTDDEIAIDEGADKNNIPLKKENHQYVFFGKDMISGLGLSLIEVTRMFTPEGRAAILQSHQGNIDKTINSIFCPEIKVPRMVCAPYTNGEYVRPA